MTGPKFTARADGDLVRMVIVVTGETFQSWALTQSEARDLRDALTLSLVPVGWPAPLPCRITKGRKACRSCGAASGQAHAEGCAEVLQPAEDERRVGPPDRRAAGCWSRIEHAKLRDGFGLSVFIKDPPTPEEKAAGERIETAACFDPRVTATLDRYFAPLEDPLAANVRGVAALLDATDPPTPEEKAAGERAFHVACDECFRFPPRHSWDCSKRRD